MKCNRCKNELINEDEEMNEFCNDCMSEMEEEGILTYDY